MADDAAMIAQGERSGAWPTALRTETILTSSGLAAPGKAIVATYAGHPEACLAVNGDRYRATATTEWRTLVRAAVAAGAKPTGAFALRDGARCLATFEVGQTNGLRTQLVLVDAFDGSLKLTCGFSSVRVVCANTLSTCLSSDGAGMAMLRHTASLETKVNVLAESIQLAIASGDKVRDAYHQAEATSLNREQAIGIFDLLFPAAPEGTPAGRAKTLADNMRADARRAMANPVNNVGATLATVWNAATYLVDREADGSARKARGGDALDSLLFGSRGERVNEIQTIVDVVLRDGSVRSVPATEALDMGVDPKLVGRAFLDEFMGGQ
jgi:hypothetical protein